MFGYTFAYFVALTVNNLALRESGISLDNPVWWISLFCVVAAYIIGREQQSHLDK